MKAVQFVIRFFVQIRTFKVELLLWALFAIKCHVKVTKLAITYRDTAANPELWNSNHAQQTSWVSSLTQFARQFLGNSGMSEQSRNLVFVRKFRQNSEWATVHLSVQLVASKNAKQRDEKNLVKALKLVTLAQPSPAVADAYSLCWTDLSMSNKGQH